MSSIGKNIRKFRIERKLTQKKLAELTGLNEVTIRSYESDKYSPKYENVLKLASALKIQPHQLIHYNDFGLPIPNISYPDGAMLSLSQVLNDLVSGNDVLISDINQYMARAGYNNFDVKKIVDGTTKLNYRNKYENDLFRTLSDYFATDTNIVVFLEDAFYGTPVRQELLNLSVEEETTLLSKIDIEIQEQHKENVNKIFDSLNSEGQTKLLDFALMLVKIPDYLKHEE